MSPVLSAQESLEGWLFDEVIHRQNLLADTTILTLLASLSDSMDWLGGQIDALGFAGSATAMDGGAGVTADAGSAGATSHAGRRAQLRRRIMRRRWCKDPSLDEAVPSNMDAIAAKFRALSENILIALRLEFRVRCHYFLRGVRDVSYAASEWHDEPDFFIAQYNKDLAMADDVLTAFLPPLKIRYLFSGLPRLLARILIQSAKHISAINANGVARMLRNVSALAQNLSNVVEVAELSEFERVRVYYELLNLGENRLMQVLADHVFTFGADECRELVALLSPGRKPSQRTLLVLETLCASAAAAAAAAEASAFGVGVSRS